MTIENVCEAQVGGDGIDLMWRLDAPVMVHPPAIGFGEELMGEYPLASAGRLTNASRWPV